jgi:nucleoside-diphosphate-sugar epimerase
VYKQNTGFTWCDTYKLKDEFEECLLHFFNQFELNDNWQIIWAAGKTTMRSIETSTQVETDNFKAFLQILDKIINQRKYYGVFGFASSAGGIYTKSQESPISEYSITSPSTPYAIDKLNQEKVLTAWALNCTYCTKLLIARISNLYGPMQDLNKNQGLISQIIRCLKNSEVLNIFAQMETSRDYIWSDDAAKMFLWHLEQENITSSNPTRIIANETSYTISEILEFFHSITGILPRINVSEELNTYIYPEVICFKSKYPISEKGFIRISLNEGIKRMLSL